MAPMYKKLMRSVGKAASDTSKWFQKGGHEVLFRKIKNSAAGLMPMAETAGKLANTLAPSLATLHPSAGAVATSIGAALPRIVGNVRDTASDFQQAAKKQRTNNLERPAAAGGESQMFA